MPKGKSKLKKGNQNARVLSILAGGVDEEDEEEVRSEPAPAPVQRMDDKAAQDHIRDALVEEFFGGRKASKPRRKARPRPEPEEPAQAAAPAESAPAQPVQEAPAPEESAPPVVESPPPAPEPVPAQPVQEASAPEESAPPVVKSPPPAPEQPAVRQVEAPVTEVLEAPVPVHVEPPVQEAPTPVTPPAQPKPLPPGVWEESVSQPRTPPVVESPPPAPVPSAPQAPASEAVAAEAKKQSKKDPNDFICYNLTQALVEAKADKYMHMFGMCTCQRCKVDVTAIALSNLPSKYVATQNRDVLPLLSMYEGKYSAAVITQVMGACKMVMARPHHGR